jgi:hypothetical protein
MGVGFLRMAWRKGGMEEVDSRRYSFIRKVIMRRIPRTRRTMIRAEDQA